MSKTPKKPRDRATLITSVLLYGICGACLVFVIITTVYYWVSNEATAAKARVLINLKEVGVALSLYADAYNDRLPPADRWEDVIRPTLKDPAILDPRSLRSPSIAFNRSLSGTSFTTIDAPALTPMIFESRLSGPNAAGGRADVFQPESGYPFFAAVDTGCRVLNLKNGDLIWSSP